MGIVGCDSAPVLATSLLSLDIDTAMFSARISQMEFPERRNGVHSMGFSAFVLWAVCWGRRALCGLRGHEMLRHFEPGRLSLRCFMCGAETAGWTIDVRPEFGRGGLARVHARHHMTRVPHRPHCDRDAQSVPPQRLAA
jgi:hypothetical protein